MDKIKSVDSMGPNVPPTSPDTGNLDLKRRHDSNLSSKSSRDELQKKLAPIIRDNSRK
jgi:hypothetical protein